QDHTPYIQKENSSYIFVSKNGKYCRTKHALSGGSVGLFDGKRIGRAKHLEQLGREIEELGAALNKIKASRDNSQQWLKETKQKKEALATDKNKLQQELNKAAH